MKNNQRAKLFDKFLSTILLDANSPDVKKWRTHSYEELYGRFLPKNKNAKILDIGSGMGHFLYFLTKKGYRNILGVDISKEAVNFCKNNVTKKVKLISSLQSFLKKRKNYYDLVVLNDVIEHFKKDEIIEILELIYGSLKNNGRIFVKTFNAAALTGFYGRYQDFTHEVSFTETSLPQVLQIAGFQKYVIFGRQGNWLKTKLHFLLMKLIYRIERGGVLNPHIFSTILIVVAQKQYDK